MRRWIFPGCSCDAASHLQSNFGQAGLDKLGGPLQPGAGALGIGDSTDPPLELPDGPSSIDGVMTITDGPEPKSQWVLLSRSSTSSPASFFGLRTA